ncbi:DUF7693 family protein [Pseudomonas kairouanensis]|nr:hypothetical protein [Pseudomonas kairouanensis]
MCPPLSAREVCQVLREVTWGRRVMTRAGHDDAGHVTVDIDGWRISIHADGGELDHCAACVSPDGQRWSFGSGDRFGTDPVALLSTWEHRAFGELLKML